MRQTTAIRLRGKKTAAYQHYRQGQSKNQFFAHFFVSPANSNNHSLKCHNNWKSERKRNYKLKVASDLVNRHNRKRHCVAGDITGISDTYFIGQYLRITERLQGKRYFQPGAFRNLKIICRIIYKTQRPTRLSAYPTEGRHGQPYWLRLPRKAYRIPY